MADHPSPAGSATSGGYAFDERLSVPWWWYVPAVGIGVLLGAELHMGYGGLRSWVGYAVLVPLAGTVGRGQRQWWRRLVLGVWAG